MRWVCVFTASCTLGVAMLFILDSNCWPDWPEWVCYCANVAGLVNTGFLFIWLLPQVAKNFYRRSVSGLSFLWVAANFCASIVNLFFVFSVEIPLYSRVASVYVPLVEFTILVQFFIFAPEPITTKLLALFVNLIVWGCLIELELNLPEAKDKLQWIAIALWCFQLWPQVVLNIKLHSTSGLAAGTVMTYFFSKTAAFMSAFGLNIPLQYVVMMYFDGSSAFIVAFQLFYYTKDSRLEGHSKSRGNDSRSRASTEETQNLLDLSEDSEDSEDPHPVNSHPEDSYPKDSHPEDTKDSYPKDSHHKDSHTEDTKDSYPKDSHHKDSHTEDSYPKDSHPKDSHPEDSHHKDSHPVDLHSEDSHPKDSHPEDSHPEDSHPVDLHSEDPRPDEPETETGVKRQCCYCPHWVVMIGQIVALSYISLGLVVLAVALFLRTMSYVALLGPIVVFLIVTIATEYYGLKRRGYLKFEETTKRCLKNCFSKCGIFKSQDIELPPD